VLSCTCMVFAEKKPLAAETVMLQKKATMPRLMPSNSQSPSPSPDVSEATPTPSPTPSPRIRKEKETLLENTWSGDENSWNETGDENSWNDGCDPYSSNGNACDPYGSDDGCDPYGSDPYGSDDGCDPYGSNGDACDPYAVVAVTTTLAPMNQTGGQPSGGPSALPTCSGDANSWNAGYGPCTSYAASANYNHNFCPYDYCMPGTPCEMLYAHDVCPQCGQCSSPVLAPAPAPMLLRRDKMKHQVWRQRNERDSKFATYAKVKAASTKKQKTSEPTAKQKVTAASGEAVMFQAAQTMSRSSNELRL